MNGLASRKMPRMVTWARGTPGGASDCVGLLGSLGLVEPALCRRLRLVGARLGRGAWEGPQRPWAVYLLHVHCPCAERAPTV
jgi:hypothetical protein